MSSVWVPTVDHLPLASKGIYYALYYTKQYISLYCDLSHLPLDGHCNSEVNRQVEGERGVIGSTIPSILAVQP